eukprot:COSAG01_NODE_22677_length_845_cov_47.839142_1_plen_66_part_10
MSDNPMIDYHTYFNKAYHTHTYTACNAHPLSLRGMHGDVEAINIASRGPPWWGVVAVPAPPGHRCD